MNLVTNFEAYSTIFADIRFLLYANEVMVYNGNGGGVFVIGRNV